MLSMLRWLRRRREARRRVVEDANRLRKPAGQSEQPSGPDPIEELVRIVGESDPGERRVRPRPRTGAQSARRNLPRRYRGAAPKAIAGAFFDSDSNAPILCALARARHRNVASRAA
jgi:hypothetical protein